MKSKIQTLLIIGFIICTAGLVRAADVTVNWNTKCASCHAKDGSGNTVMGKKTGVKDYRDPAVQTELSDEKATKIIKEGIPDKMKPFKDILTDDEIKALVAHIRSFKK
jgi:cytochrome c553